MEKADIYKMLDRESDELASWVVSSGEARSRKELQSLKTVVGSSQSPYKHVFSNIPERDFGKSILISMLYSSADPLTAQTSFFKEFYKFLESVCDKAGLPYKVIVPLVDVENELLAAYGEVLNS
ncbi:hypothetical protein [Larsenimonas rhizosphaerae]|uniref:Uncharacterized protein n=1 Tax=Larsenimonas rhizosphaerae TaxID=2944682 RepID=A0AA42CT34_9GAMM|nr:hypothetical protein [Larsenimonas rhizosphaerae]MCX2522739.1 hypothetical protein [Larsenimonas rhizosphaerae]